MITVLIFGCVWWSSQNPDDKEIGNSNVLSMCSICAHYSIAWCSTITCSTLLYFSVYCCRSSNYWVVTVEGSGVFKHLNILMFNPPAHNMHSMCSMYQSNDWMVTVESCWELGSLPSANAVTAHLLSLSKHLQFAIYSIYINIYQHIFNIFNIYSIYSSKCKRCDRTCSPWVNICNLKYIQVEEWWAKKHFNHF